MDDLSGMNVLVTGGTGFVGRAILRELHRAGHGILLLARDLRAPGVQRLAAQYGAEIREGGVLDAAALKSALRGAEAVIHLVGIIREVGKQTFENLHTQATGVVVEATQKAGLRRYLHMSALGTRPDTRARYHQTKWAAEEIVRGSGLDWTIFRPSLIYGPEDQFVNLFVRLAKFSPVLPVVGRPTSLMQPVSVEVVARAFVSALGEPRAVGKTLDLCGPERLTLTEILRTLLEVTGRRRWIVRVPPGLARLQAALFEAIYPALLHRAPPLNRDQLLMLQEDNVGDPQPATALFNLRQPPFREGIAAYLK